jgi:FtsH-binding integral membrane protein
MAEKIAIFGAPSLYLDFVNLFQFLMKFWARNVNFASSDPHVGV